ncbi:MAG: hypothetical protein ABSH51_13655 [Solirubrobacteraceae bacterium]|jgi:hypothetical protein
MTTILILNAISLLLSAAGIGGVLTARERRLRRDVEAATLYVTTDTPAPRPPARR